MEGAGRDEPVKFSFLCLDSYCISQGEHGHEMKGRGQEALTAVSEVTLLGSFGVCSFELLSPALPLGHGALVMGQLRVQGSYKKKKS